MIEKVEVGKVYYYETPFNNLIKILDDEDAPIYHIMRYDLSCGHIIEDYQSYFDLSRMYEVDPKLTDKFENCYKLYLAGIFSLFEQTMMQIERNEE